MVGQRHQHCFHTFLNSSYYRPSSVFGNLVSNISARISRCTHRLLTTCERLELIVFINGTIIFTVFVAVRLSSRLYDDASLFVNGASSSFNDLELLHTSIGMSSFFAVNLFYMFRFLYTFNFLFKSSQVFLFAPSPSGSISLHGQPIFCSDLLSFSSVFSLINCIAIAAAAVRSLSSLLA